MKNWIISHKKSIILSVLVTLLPMVAGLILWNELPDTLLITGVPAAMPTEPAARPLWCLAFL